MATLQILNAVHDADMPQARADDYGRLVSYRVTDSIRVMYGVILPTLEDERENAWRMREHPNRFFAYFARSPQDALQRYRLQYEMNGGHWFSGYSSATTNSFAGRTVRVSKITAVRVGTWGLYSPRGISTPPEQTSARTDRPATQFREPLSPLQE